MVYEEKSASPSATGPFVVIVTVVTQLYVSAVLLRQRMCHGGSTEE